MTNYISNPLSTLNEDLNAVQTTLSSKADKSELTAYAQLSDIPDVPTGDYLPLSGGNLSGRINLITTAQGDYSYQGTHDFSVDSSHASEPIEGTVQLTVSIDQAQHTGTMAIQDNDFIGGTEIVNFTYEGIDDGAYKYTWSRTPDADYSYWGGEAWVRISVANPSADPSIYVSLQMGPNDDYYWVGSTLGWNWTITGESTTTIDPFLLSSEFAEAIGDINAILDSINGEVI